METCITHGIEVTVESFYVEQHSDPSQDSYAFAYRVIMTNVGERPLKLLSRHWIITDGNGDTQEVRGEGVVGKQPTLLPGEPFEYTSGSRLNTPVGTMHGTYTMLSEDNEEVDVTIPCFTLMRPGTLN